MASLIPYLCIIGVGSMALLLSSPIWAGWILRWAQRLDERAADRRMVELMRQDMERPREH